MGNRSKKQPSKISSSRLRFKKILRKRKKVKSSQPEMNANIEVDALHTGECSSNIDKPEMNANIEVDALQTGECSSNIENLNVSNNEPTAAIVEIATDVEGTRLVDYQYFWKELLKISNHSQGKFDCKLTDLMFIYERKNGLISTIFYKCKVCNSMLDISTSPQDTNFDINLAAVAGTVTSGNGYSQLNQILATVNVPTLSQGKYLKIQEKASDTWEEIATKSMNDAAEEEKKIAIEEGSVDVNGVPIIRVVCDGSWAKRSYRSNYSSLSGVAAIVGYKTRKVLYMDVKSKYCIICKIAENKKEIAGSHKCYKNWEDSSTSMESTIIMEGFGSSLQMYGIIYGEMIADGDSSTYRKILDLNPYPTVKVAKIECKNHLLRNYTNKIRELCKDPSAAEPMVRKLVQSKILRFRAAVDRALVYRKNQEGNLDDKIHRLKKDILNSPSHIFGEHLNCRSLGYFCLKDKPENDNFVPYLKRAGIYDKLLRHVKNIAFHAKSLIHDVNSNSVEHLFSTLVKFTGGKRINFCGRRSFRTRCFLSAIARNTNKPYSAIYFTSKKTPPTFVKSLEQRRERRHELFSRKPRRKLIKINTEKDQDYGSFAARPNMTDDEMLVAKEEFINHNLKLDEKQRAKLEADTQHNLGLWKEERKKLVTASNAGKICKLKAYTSCKNTVFELLYGGEKMANSLLWGQINELNAVKAVTDNLGIQFKKCGLFTCSKAPFLGATPDGVSACGQILLEVKCPYSARDITPEEGIQQKKITFWRIEGSAFTINKNHNWYYQIQQQLYVTEKTKCIFGCWTTKGIKIEMVTYDKIFFEIEALPKLKKFYYSCLLPELADPKGVKDLIQEPNHIIKAQQEKLAKDTKKAMAKIP